MDLRSLWAKKKKIYQGVFFLLVATEFFELKILHHGPYRWLMLVLCLWMVLGALKAKGSVVGKMICAYFAFFVISSLYAMFFYHQSIVEIFKQASPMYIGLFSFFLWMRQNVTAKETMIILRWFSIAFCVCYIFQWLVYPHVLFYGAVDKLNVSVTYYRLRMPGSIGAYYLFFDGLRLFQKGKKIKGGGLMIMGILPILIMGFRSLTMLSCLFGVIMLFQLFKMKSIKSWMTLFLLIVSFLGVSQMPIVQKKMNEMQNRQESDQDFSNPDYIRYFEYQYYTSYVFSNPADKILGGGLPVNGAYANKFEIAYKNGLYWVDLGLVGLAMVVGPATVLLLVFVVLRCAWKCADKNLLHLRYTLLTVLLGSVITSMELYRQGNLLVIGVMLYLEYAYNEKECLKNKDLLIL